MMQLTPTVVLGQIIASLSRDTISKPMEENFDFSWLPHLVLMKKVELVIPCWCLENGVPRTCRADIRW